MMIVVSSSSSSSLRRTGVNRTWARPVPTVVRKRYQTSNGVVVVVVVVATFTDPVSPFFFFFGVTISGVSSRVHGDEHGSDIDVVKKCCMDDVPSSVTIFHDAANMSRHNDGTWSLFVLGS